jgi:hypothetical protein
MHNTSIYFMGVRDDFFKEREKRIPRHSSLTCACKQTDLEDDIKKVSVINRTRNILKFFSLVAHSLFDVRM